MDKDAANRAKLIIDSYRIRGVEIRADYLEKMCAAYLLLTDIDPEKVVLVEEHAGLFDNGMSIRWYFRKRELEPDEHSTIHDTTTIQ